MGLDKAFIWFHCIMIRGAPATGPPLFLSPEKEGEANMHEYFMYPETDAAKSHERFMYPDTDNDILRVTFSSPCRVQQNTPHKRPGTGRIRANPHQTFMCPKMDDAKPHESRIHPKMDNANTRHSFSTENVCRAYSIRPYTGTKMVRAGWHIPDSFHYSTFAL